MWLICYYSKDLYSPSIHQLWLPRLIILRPWKQHGVWTIQRFSLFLYYFYKCCILFKLYYRAFSLRWPASMQICWNKRKRLHKKRVELPKDWFGTPTWLPFHCFGTPIWQPWHHVKTLYTADMLADMLTDMVDMLTNVQQYWPRFGQDIDWMWADMSTEGCLQCTRYKKFMIKCIVCL